MIFKFFKKLFRHKNQKGVSLAEALAAITVSTMVLGAGYTIYNQFQGTFVRQISHNNLKQEARFALYSLQLDARLAGYKHPDSTLGEVQAPVKVLNDDDTEVSNDTEFGEKIYFCFDIEDSSGAVERRLTMYEKRKAYSTSENKTILKKKVFKANKCDPADSTNVLISDWIPVAQYFDFFGIRLRSKHVDYEIRMQTPDGTITETFTASAFMRNLNFGGKTYYAYDEDDLHESRVAVLPFTGSMQATCPNDIKLDIQLASFTTNDDIIILHQGETVGDELQDTFPTIRIVSEKPPEITGIPSLSHDDMRIKATTVSANTTLPPGLSASSGFVDSDDDGVKDSDEAWDGTLIIKGTLNKTNNGYTFNADGYQDFNIRVKSDLDTNCQSNGWSNQSEVYKDYKIRVMKFDAPQFSDVNLHAWEARGQTFGRDQYERHGTGSWQGGPFYDKTTDGRAFYIQQNLSNPAFLVSQEEYDSFVLKGMICSGGYPDCQPSMNAWGDDDMLGFAVGLQRPSVPFKVWPDGKIRACAGVNYLAHKSNSSFSSTNLANTLRNNEKTAWNALSTDQEKQDWWGQPNDITMDMYLWSWWGAVGNASEIIVHHLKGYEATHTDNCGFSESYNHQSHDDMGKIMGWSTPSSGQLDTFRDEGYNTLFRRRDATRPDNTGTRKCWSSRANSFSRISYLPGATHKWTCGHGQNYGVKNIVTLTYTPRKFKAIVDNKPISSNADNIRLNAFDLRFTSAGVLQDHLSTTFPHPVVTSPSNIALPSGDDHADDLKADNFKRFQKGSIGLTSYSQPDNRYSNIQIARLPRYVPEETAANKPMPQANDISYYMDETYLSINKIYGLLSKSYDPVGRHLEVLVQANTPLSSNCYQVGIGTVETGSFKSQTVDGASRTMNCRLSGTWRATTEEWANQVDLPNIGEFYDTKRKANYSGARATITTTEGNTVQVFADGSFQYTTLTSAFQEDTPRKDSFYYAVQTEDTSGNRISNIQKVYIGWKIANTTPSGVSFREDGQADDADAMSDLTNFDIAEDDKKDKVVGEIYASSTNDPDTNDFVRVNLGLVPDNDPDKDVDHGSRFRIDQIDDRFYLVLNDPTDIRWANLPSNKKYFAVRLVLTDLRGNQLRTTQKVYVDRVDCSETAMENIKVYKTKVAMTLEGYVQGEQGEKVFRRQTVPLTSALDEAVLRFDYPNRSVQPSVRIKEETITVDGESRTVGMLSNRCKDTHNFINRQQLWSDG